MKGFPVEIRTSDLPITLPAPGEVIIVLHSGWEGTHHSVEWVTEPRQSAFQGTLRIILEGHLPVTPADIAEVRRAGDYGVPIRQHGGGILGHASPQQLAAAAASEFARPLRVPVEEIPHGARHWFQGSTADVWVRPPAALCERDRKSYDLTFERRYDYPTLDGLLDAMCAEDWDGARTAPSVDPEFYYRAGWRRRSENRFSGEDDGPTGLSLAAATVGWREQFIELWPVLPTTMRAGERIIADGDDLDDAADELLADAQEEVERGERSRFVRARERAVRQVRGVIAGSPRYGEDAPSPRSCVVSAWAAGAPPAEIAEEAQMPLAEVEMYISAYLADWRAGGAR